MVVCKCKNKKRLPILNEEMQFNDSLQSTHLFPAKTCKAKKYRKSVVRFIWELNKTLVGPFSNFYIVASKYIKRTLQTIVKAFQVYL